MSLANSQTFRYRNRAVRRLTAVITIAGEHAFWADEDQFRELADAGLATPQGTPRVVHKLRLLVSTADVTGNTGVVSTPSFGLSSYGTRYTKVEPVQSALANGFIYQFKKIHKRDRNCFRQAQLDVTVPHPAHLLTRDDVKAGEERKFSAFA